MGCDNLKTNYKNDWLFIALNFNECILFRSTLLCLSIIDWKNVADNNQCKKRQQVGGAIHYKILDFEDNEEDPNGVVIVILLLEGTEPSNLNTQNEKR